VLSRPSPTRTCVAAAALAGLLAGGCHRGHHHETAVSAEQAVMDRQREGLRALLAASERGDLLPFQTVLVAVDEGLVRRLLQATLPFERVIANRYRVRVSGVDVKFDDGFGLVRLNGRASLADRSESEAFAEVSVYGALDVVELDRTTGTLRGSVTIIAMDARRVNVMGAPIPKAEQLIEDFGRERLDAFGALASRLEIPVAVEGALTLPAVGPEGGVRIEAATIPLRAAVSRVTAYRGRLWISVQASTGEGK
jgi:hypothetical protein